MRRRLQFGIGRSDRTQPVIDRRVCLRTADAEFADLPHEEIFRRAFDEAAYDVAELSLANFVVMTAAGRCPYVALPIFTSRTFRHATIYIRTDRGIETARDLKDKRVGLREFSNTATVTAKGMLADEYGLQQRDSSWRYGPVNRGEPRPIVRRIPRDIDAAPLGEGDCLSDLLASGSLDAVIAYAAPACFERGHPKIARLFPDYRAAERAYFSRSGVLPIMHLLGIRKGLARSREICADICETFERAKWMAMSALENTQALSVMLPWIDTFVRDVQAVMGADYWPYGVTSNRKPLQAILRWLKEQDLAEEVPPLASLFAEPVRDWMPDPAQVNLKRMHDG